MTYRNQTGRDVAFIQGDKIHFLNPMTLTVGSFVISDAARSNEVDRLLNGIQDAVKPSLGIFIDTVSFTRDGQSCYVSREIPGNFDRHFEQLGLE
jgi:hypothetical protein